MCWTSIFTSEVTMSSISFKNSFLPAKSTNIIISLKFFISFSPNSIFISVFRIKFILFSNFSTLLTNQSVLSYPRRIHNLEFVKHPLIQILYNNHYIQDFLYNFIISFKICTHPKIYCLRKCFFSNIDEIHLKF